MKYSAIQNEETTKQNLSHNLLYLRISKKPPMTQAMLAKTLGIGQKSLSNYERGLVMPPVHVLTRIADYFQVSTDALLYGKLPKRKKV